MDRYEISSEEKAFIIGGIEANLRNDGRERIQYRPLHLEVDCIKRAMGSARVRLGENIVIATVKGDLTTPAKESPDRGSINFHIDYSAEAKPRVEGERRGLNNGGWKARMCWAVKEGYREVGLGGLVVVEGARVWELDVTVLVVAAGGAGLLDAISFALRAALTTTSLPLVKTIDRDADDYEIKIDEFASYTPKLENVPNFITLCKVGSNYVLDPTYEESLCSELKFVVSMTGEGKIVSIFKEGCGCVHPTSLQENCEILAKISEYLENAMQKVLKVQNDSAMET